VKKLLLQLDTSSLPSVFDRVVAHDGGADDVMAYGGITPDTVRDLVRTAFERPDEKRTNPGAATLLREMSRAGFKRIGKYDFTKSDGQDYFLIFVAK